MYGDQVVVLLELEILSLDGSLDGLIPNEDKGKSSVAQLEALERKRVNVLEHLLFHHSRI